MRTIQKGPQPPCLVEYQAASRRAVPRPKFDDVLGPCKDALRQALVRDQGSVCCYCMDRIRADRASMKVAHWQSQHLHPDRVFDFANLFGACLGSKDKPRNRQHCDTYQGDRDFHTQLDHPTLRIERLVRYTRKGRVSAPDDPKLNSEIDEVLNLNEDDLCRKREDVLNGFLDAMRRRHAGPWSEAVLTKERSDWSTPGRKGYRPFFGVVIELLDRRLVP